jgi:hypothetical protein
MSFELGISVGMTVICFLFAYFCVNEKNDLFKWFYLILSFSFMTATLNIMKRIAVSESLPAAVASGFETLELVMMAFIFLLIALFFIIILKNVFDMWFPKKKSFKESTFGD